MKTYTLCGSMRFAREMQEIAYTLETRQGYNILQCVYCEENLRPTGHASPSAPKTERRKLKPSQDCPKAGESHFSHKKACRKTGRLFCMTLYLLSAFFTVALMFGAVKP